MIRSLTLALGGGVAALGIALVLTAPASDAAGKGRGGMAACRVDAATFCGNVEAGRGARMKCLIGNIDKLQSTCATAVEARMADRASRRADAAGQPPLNPGTAGEAPKAAEDDEDAMPTQPGGAAPPLGNPDRPLAGRRAAEGRIDGRGGERPMRACRADMQTLCATVEAGGGARIRCLAENRAKVSPACADALATIAERRADARAACKADSQALCAGAKGPERRQCLTANVDRVSPTCASTLKGARDGQRG